MTTQPTPRVEQMVKYLLAHAAEIERGSVTVQFDAWGTSVKAKLTKHEALGCRDPQPAA